MDVQCTNQLRNLKGSRDAEEGRQYNGGCIVRRLHPNTRNIEKSSGWNKLRVGDKFAKHFMKLQLKSN